MKVFNPAKVKVYAVSLEFLTLAPSWTSSIFVHYIYVIVWGNAWRRSFAFLAMLSSFLHSGLSSAPLPQSVSAEGSQTVSTIGASTVSTSGEEQRGVQQEVRGLQFM